MSVLSMFESALAIGFGILLGAVLVVAVFLGVARRVLAALEVAARPEGDTNTDIGGRR